MKDPGTILQTKYFEALDGNITSNIVGSTTPITVSIYDDFAPDEVGYPYIILSEMTNSDESEKTNHLHNTTMLIDIVAGYMGQGGKKDIHNMSNQVLQIVRTRTSGYLDLSPNFKMVTATLDSSNMIVEETETHKVYRKLLRIRNIVTEL